MRHNKFLSAVLLAGLCAVSIPSHAQNNPLITVDENGHGSLVFPGGGPITTTGVLAPDPGPGGLPLALTYNLLGPPSLVEGDVFMVEPGGGIEDVIRFNPAGTGGDPNYPASLVFYSDNIGGFEDMADTPSPPLSFYTNTATIQEVGPEGDNGAFYTPTANQPGFVPGFSVTYHFISDAPVVPEPGSVALLTGMTLTGAAFLRRRKQASKAA